MTGGRTPKILFKISDLFDLSNAFKSCLSNTFMKSD